MDIVFQFRSKVNQVFDEQHVEELAREVDFTKRIRKIKPKQLLEKLIFQNLESPSSSLENLSFELSKENTVISKQALHKKFNPTTVLLFEKILEELLQNTLRVHAPWLEAFPFIKRIQIADSSEIKLNKVHSNLFPQVRKQGAAIKLQAIVDAVNDQILSFAIRPSKEPDQSYKSYISLMQEGDLMIADLGYFCLDSFYKIQINKGFFLSRYYKQTNLFDVENEVKIDLRNILKNTKSTKLDLPILLGTAKFPCRLVAIKLTREAYKKRLKHLKEKRRRDPDLNKSNDELNRWTIFVTNLPLSLKAENLLCFYSVRWQIELLFKTMKTFLNLRKVDSTNQHRTLISIYTSLITITLLSFVTATIEDKEVSLYKASIIFIKNIRAFFNLIHRKLCAITWLKKILCQFALKESRQKRPSTKLSLKALRLS